MASLCLHNPLRTKSADSYTPVNFVDHFVNGTLIDGEWLDSSQPANIAPLQPHGAGRVPLKATEVCEAFMNYFNGSGQTHWQWKTLVN